MTPRSKAPQRRALLPEEKITLRALTDVDSSVRRSAAVVLGMRQDPRPEMTAALRELVRHPDDDTRAAAHKALTWSKGGITVKMLPELARIAEDRKASAELQEQAVKGIETLGSRAAPYVPMLLRLVELRTGGDSYNHVASAAGYALASVGDASALAAVVKGVEAGRCDWEVLRRQKSVA